MFIYKSSRGEIATLLTLISVGLMLLGTMVGSYVAQRETRTKGNASGDIICGKMSNGQDCKSDQYGNSKFCYNECIPEKPGFARQVFCSSKGYERVGTFPDSNCPTQTVIGDCNESDAWVCEWPDKSWKNCLGKDTSTEEKKGLFIKTYCPGPDNKGPELMWKYQAAKAHNPNGEGEECQGIKQKYISEGCGSLPPTNTPIPPLVSSPTSTDTPTPTNTPTPTDTPTLTPIPRGGGPANPTPTDTLTPTITITPTLTPTLTKTPTSTPDNRVPTSPTSTNIPTPTLTPTLTATPTMTETPTPTPFSNSAIPLCKFIDGGDQANPEGKLNIVLIADGFTDLKEFLDNAESQVKLMSLSGLKEEGLYSKMNFWANTTLESGMVWLHLITKIDWDRMKAIVLMSNCKGQAYVIISKSFDSDEAGISGMGPWNGNAAVVHASYIGVLAHELGHAISGVGLGDEYFPAFLLPFIDVPNCSDQGAEKSTLSCWKWKYLNDDNTNCLPGCTYATWFRPTDNSIMRYPSSDLNNPSKFNKPSLEAWRKGLEKYRL